MSPQRGERRRLAVRVTAALATSAVAAVLTAFVPMAPAGADDTGQGPLSVVGGLPMTDDAGNAFSGNPQLLGLDPSQQALVLLDSGSSYYLANHKPFNENILINVDTTNLTIQRRVDTGTAGSVTGAVDPTTHRVFLSSLCAGGDACPPDSTGALTQSGAAQALTYKTPTTLHTIDLNNPSAATTYTFPQQFAGESVIGYAPFDTPEHHWLYVLLFQQVAPSSYVQGTEHQSALFLLDEDKLASSDPDVVKTAAVWSQGYDVSRCATYADVENNDTAVTSLGVATDGSFVYFPCRGFAVSAAGGQLLGATMTAAPAGAVVVDTPVKTITDPSTFTTSFYPYAGNAAFLVSGHDNAGELLWMGAPADSASTERMTVFDVRHRAFTGSVVFPLTDATPPGVQPNGAIEGVATDGSSGRAYLVPNVGYVPSMFGRQVPVAQGDVLEEADVSGGGGGIPVFDPVTSDLFLAGQFSGDAVPPAVQAANHDGLLALHDSRPEPTPPPEDDPDAATHNIPIVPGVTPVSYSGVASGYGARAIEVGGVSSSQAKAGVGVVANIEENLNAALAQIPFGSFPGYTGPSSVPSVQDASRSIFFGRVDDTSVSNSGTGARGEPLLVDETTQAQLSSALSSESALPKQVTDPLDAQRSGAQSIYSGTGCHDYGEKAQAGQSPGAAVSCDAKSGTASGASSADLTGQDLPLDIGLAATATKVVADPVKGITSTTTARASGIRISVPQAGTLSIGDVSATATSTADGLPGTASSSLTSSVRAVRITDATGAEKFSCGFGAAPCDPSALTAAVDAQFPGHIRLLTAAPDTDPNVTGSPGGAQAVIKKSEYAHFNDFFTNADDTYEVPALTLMLVNDQAQPSRLVLQFAATQVQSHFYVGLLPPPPVQLPNPTLTLTLVDGSTPPRPLSGGVFDLVDSTGATVDTCTTAADGVGTCKFSSLSPGSYTVHEATPPPGFATAPDYPVELDAGQDYTATFVNLPAIGSVSVSLTGAADHEALARGVFALFKGSSVLGTPIATCATGKKGTCGFAHVPLGDYRMHQTKAPSGFLLSKDVPFSLTTPGQQAELDFVDGVPAKKAVPPRFIPGKPAVPPHTEVLHIGGGGKSAALGAGPLPVVSSVGSDGTPPLVVGGPLHALTRVPAQLARLLTHSPQQAVLLLFVWLVLGLPVYLWVRRRQFLIATEGS